MRKTLLQAAALLLLASSLHAAPNFVFVLIDDMGYADMSCYGEKRVQTRHLDRLAAEGIRFTQFYVGSPICSPSRTAFTTGQSPARWRITSFLSNRQHNEDRGMAQWLDPAAPTLARILKQNGYATGHFGKWHMGGQRDVGEAPLITEYGFDASLTQFEGLGDRILPLLDAYDGKPARKYSLGSDNLGRGEIAWMDRSKVTGAFVERAIGFMKDAAQKNQPFYVNLWPDDVHSPFFPPKDLRKTEAKDELYRAVVLAMDEQLGALFDFVRSNENLRTNTVIIVASDNGPEPGAGSAGQFRGTKGMLYEGGIREPFIVWAPGLMKQGRVGTVNDRMVLSALDLLPSVARIAGARLPKDVAFDGEEMSAIWLGKTDQVRRKPLMWNRPPDRPGPPNNRLPDLAIRSGDWKLTMMQNGTRVQLFDLAKDPAETTNIADKESRAVRGLTNTLSKWWAEVDK